jgi:hypothetical protein
MIRNKLGEMRAYMETYCCSGKKKLKHNYFKGEICGDKQNSKNKLTRKMKRELRAMVRTETAYTVR